MKNINQSSNSNFLGTKNYSHSSINSQNFENYNDCSNNFMFCHSSTEYHSCNDRNRSMK